MAPRIRHHHQQEVRDRIRVAELINVLHDCAINGALVSKERISAIKILLGKCIADLQSVQISGDADNPLEHVHRDATDSERVAAVMALIAKAK